jgi:hypothetical protein
VNLVKRIPAERPPETFPDFGPCWKPVRSHVGFPVPAAVKQQAVVPSKSGVSVESLEEQTNLPNKISKTKTNAEEPSLSAKVTADLELTAKSELKADDVSQLCEKDSALLVNQSALMRIFNVLTSEPVIRTAVRELREQLRE